MRCRAVTAVAILLFMTTGEVETGGAGEQPRDPELWKLTLAAVRGAASAVDEHLDRGGWCPRVRLAVVRAFDSGWPNISPPQLFPLDTAPVDHSALFGSKRDQLKPIAFTDVEEFTALIAFVRDRDDLRARLSMEMRTGHDDLVDRMIDLEVTDLPLSLLDRAHATGITTDDELLRPYLERERAWFLDPLPVEYVIPLALTALDLDEPLVIDARTRIEPLDEATQAARATSALSTSSVPETVVGAATHAIVLSGHQLPNPGPTQRKFTRDAELLPLADADLVCEALRVLTHVDVGYAQVLRRPLGWADRWEHDLPPLTQTMTLRRYPDKFDDYGWLEKPNPIARETLNRLPCIVGTLRTAPPNVRLAARRLSLAALREADDDRTVDACIGLEALLGEGRDELSHRLALRAATALATRPDSPADAQTVYDVMKKVYQHRSAVVHGTPADKSRIIRLGERTHSAANAAVMLLRELLTDALSRPESWTAKTLDLTLLSALSPSPASVDATSGDTASEFDATTKK